MSTVFSSPKRKQRLNKRFIATYEGYDVYTVNAFTVRNIARPDEEFSNFATCDEFRNLIPPGEIWLSDKNLDDEGLFFIANALTQLRERDRGVPEASAYTAGLNAERRLRARHNAIRYRGGRPHKRVPPRVYVAPYITLPDPKFAVEVWVVDGNQVRSLYKTDYTEGGHGYVYPWVPRHQIWIEKALDRRELPFIVSHEYLELRLMRDKDIDYDTAHGIAARLEFDLRKGRGLQPLLVPGRRRRLRKKDLTRLVKDDVFQFVLRTYVRK